MIKVLTLCDWTHTRECIIREINADKNEIRVHYVGGVEDEDEWVHVDDNKVQLPPLIEMVWVKVGDTPVFRPSSHPSARPRPLPPSSSSARTLRCAPCLHCFCARVRAGVVRRTGGREEGMRWDEMR